MAAFLARTDPVLASVGPEWEKLVERAELLSGRRQPDLRALVEIMLPPLIGGDESKPASPRAEELVAIAHLLAALPS
eukprot:SAG31_NODE_33556_length_342_cov_1.065844_1_plen_76_part_10